MKKKRVLFICLLIVLLCVTAFSSFATDFSSIGGSKGYIHATCSLEKQYHQSTYNTTREKHGLYTTIKRTSSYTSTAIPTASLTSCYVYTAVYKNNGTATGVYYDSQYKVPGSIFTNTITAKVNIPSSITVRSVNHYSYHPGVCSTGEHLYYYYDAFHSSDPY